jgi:DNA repair protein RecO (recombination protein O)
MNQLTTTGIILSRTDFQEADRIITLLTPDYGKLRLIAKGVRRVKSKLAGGIELFSVSHITFIKGRGDIGTLISTRLIKHYGAIVNDIERVQFGYELIKRLHKITEDETGREYFDLLEQAFEALNDPLTSRELLEAWFNAQLLRYGGVTPNLSTDIRGNQLDKTKRYNLALEEGGLVEHNVGVLTADHIKFLRLLFSPNKPKVLQQVQGINELLAACAAVVSGMSQQHLPA